MYNNIRSQKTFRNLAFILFCLATWALAQKPVHRFLLVTGANDGGPGRPVLRYAVTDANAFANVLGEMGGVPVNQKIVLREPGVAAMRKGFADMEAKLRDPRFAKGRREVVVYYSGHADESGLRLGREVMQWPELRKRVDALGADVKIAVLDACGSGAITRLKGGVARPAFLSDASSDMKGYAFLTSSSEDEASQESDRLRGSFFTHALVSGLRGAADMSGDGKVTLGEAYQFAFNETLQKTQTSSGGAQHPNRDMNLAGTGDVVMTDVRETSAGLTLDAGLEGRVFIRDRKGNLVAELYKSKGRSLELGLPPGQYQVQLEQRAAWTADGLNLAEGKRIVLTQKEFKPLQREAAVSRGSNNSTNPLLDSARRQPFQMGTSLLYEHSDVPTNGMQFALLVDDARAEYVGTQVSLLANVARKDMSGLQVNTGINVALGHLSGSQIGSGINIAGNMTGAQVTSGFNVADSIEGAQVSAGLNITYGAINGLQAGPINISADGGKGVQAGVVNIAADSLSGGQGGVVNIAGSVHTAQGGVVNVARHGGRLQGGVVNTAGSVESLQIGVFNTAGHVGNRQIGLINISKHSEKTPIGLINIVGNGIFDATCYADETGGMGMVLHTGTPWLYTLFEYNQEIATGNDGLNKWPQSWGLGLGTRFGMRSNYFSLDYAYLNTHSQTPHNVNLGPDATPRDSANFWHKIRFGSGLRVLPGVALTGGFSLNMLSQGYGNDFAITPRGDYHWHWTFGDEHTARFWPGVFAGVNVGMF